MVCITSDTADVLTKMGKNLSDVAYNINEEEDDDDDDDDNDDEDEDDDEVDAPEAPKGDEELARKLSKERGGTRTSSRLAKDASTLTDAQEGIAQRERRQIELMTRRNDERVRELAARSNRSKGGDAEKDQADELQTYKRTRDYPDNIQPNQVKVDMANQCVILPICGNPIPFHISTIKNIVMPDDDSATLLRINFYTAGMAVGKDAPANMAKLVAKYAPYASFIREMTFRSLDGHNLTLVSCHVLFIYFSIFKLIRCLMSSLSLLFEGFSSDLRTKKESENA
jgi:nucleosome binding factor SPN SPT16 subunit